MANQFSDDTLLARWLSGELSEAELQQLQSRPDFADFQRIAEAGSRLQVPEYDAATELTRLQARQQELKAAAKATPQQTKPFLRAVHYWSAAAGVALLLAAWFVWPPSVQEIYANAGTSLIKKNLMDGSVVQLNAGSNFTFAVNEQRQGELTGEGFFEVEKSAVPFVVETDFGTVTVLGTSFNVYARDDDFRVACATGRVRVTFTRTKDTVELTRGESVVRTGNGKATKSITDAESALDWLDGRSVFKSRPLSEILAELERQFDVEIKLPPNFNVTEKMTTDFNNTNLDQALTKIFESLLGVSYQQTGRVITITE